MNDAIATTLRTQLIPLAREQLLLPNSAVAEIIGYQAPQASEGDRPDWWLGLLTWRGLEIPLIALEVIRGGALPEITSSTRIAVFNSLSGNVNMPFYAIIVHGLPHLAKLNNEQVNALDGEAGPCGLQLVEINGDPALIPDLDAIEDLLARPG